ncbi:threonine/serine dehydratase [Actinomadura barringtoniae]|uniref:threonine ammonia-lyase n=1 Tax=Actinomadura barringtoniae TaxID=1427535 RepID=A0A939T8T2_9ACTN|nr:threonine/serine dehydratase [Actinomadura barringtoniae]MBO2447250.1 threonine/serine dehydratase [Actinomadura barringtoniae]
MITSFDARTAASRIAGRVRRTPVADVDSGGQHGSRLWFKLEHLQHTGSFKARGAFNRLLSAAEEGGLPAEGVVTASGGNAGLAVAYAASEVGVPAEVYVPVNAPATKVAKLRAIGATVVQVGDRYAEAAEAATKRAADTGALFCHAYDQPEVCAGQGTLGLELLEQTDGEVDTILISVGGGGLMAGVAAAVEGHANVVAVEPEACPTLNRALRAGRPVDVDVSGVASDSLGATRVGEIAFRVASRSGVRSVLVTDDAIVHARRRLWDRYRLVVEHGTAAALAALQSGAYRPAPGERVAVVLCGANTDPTDLVQP